MTELKRREITQAEAVRWTFPPDADRRPMNFSAHESEQIKQKLLDTPRRGWANRKFSLLDLSED